MTGPIRSFWRRTASVLVAAVVLLQAATGATHADPAVTVQPDPGAIAGRRMFFGDSPLVGTIQGHSEPLPPKVVACANCHLPASASVPAAAPRLTQSTLTQPRSRRGGPPSLFSLASFCRLLRTGVDPAYIVIPRRMPRYTLPDDKCLDLWHYLTESPDALGQN